MNMLQISTETFQDHCWDTAHAVTLFCWSNQEWCLKSIQPDLSQRELSKAEIPRFSDKCILICYSTQ